LDSLLATARKDPSLLLRHPIYVHLDKPTAHGWKFWSAATTQDGITLRWARYGQKAQEHVLATGRCRCASPFEELRYRVLDKLRKGYQPDMSKSKLPAV
jgi:predicted DNA-binding WGR domain protein